MRKLLKYDLKSLFPMWGISSLALLAFFVIGAVSLRGYNAYYKNLFKPGVLAEICNTLCSLGIMLTIVAFGVYALLNLFFTLQRFYTHFYTDQGYLTFTLPVKRTDLLTSKVMAGFLCLGASGLFMLLGIAVIALFGGDPKQPINMELIRSFQQFFVEGWKQIGGWLIVYVVQAILLLMVSMLYALLFSYSCITLGAILAKKHKILAAIGIYYASNMTLSTLTQLSILPLFSTTLITRFSEMTLSSICGAVSLILALVIVTEMTTTWLLYYLNIRLLHKNLNLA